MKNYRAASLLLLIPLLLSLFTVPAFALEDPDPNCRNAVLVDAKYGEVLYDKDAYEKAYPASITKVMTALLVLEAVEALKEAKAGHDALEAIYNPHVDFEGVRTLAALESGRLLSYLK